MEQIGVNGIRHDAAPEWQQTFDAIKDAVMLLSSDCRILRCNRAAQEIFNKGDSREMLGKICWEVAHDTAAQPRECPTKVMLKTKKRASVVLESDGRWFKITVDPILDGENNVSGVVHVVLGYLDMVIGVLPPGDPRVEKLAIARRAAREAAEVSGNLLAYTGQIQEKIELLDLAEICRASLPGANGLSLWDTGERHG